MNEGINNLCNTIAWVIKAAVVLVVLCALGWSVLIGYAYYSETHKPQPQTPDPWAVVSQNPTPELNQAKQRCLDRGDTWEDDNGQAAPFCLHIAAQATPPDGSAIVSVDKYPVVSSVDRTDLERVCPWNSLVTPACQKHFSLPTGRSCVGKLFRTCIGGVAPDTLPANFLNDIPPDAKVVWVPEPACTALHREPCRFIKGLKGYYETPVGAK